MRPHPLPPVSRRNFLDLAWKALLSLSGLLTLGGLLRFWDFQPDPPAKTEFDLGLPQAYPPDSQTVIPAARAVLFRIPEGFLALSLVCPHLGCQVNPTSEGFACPCHGSRFGPQGAPLRGPP